MGNLLHIKIPRQLIIIKIIHTMIWGFFNLVLGYLFFAIFSSQINFLFWLGIGFILVEFVVLMIFKWNCPLTIMARKYSDSERENFDIYLPLWLAKHNKTIYTTIFLILIGLYLFKFGIQVPR